MKINEIIINEGILDALKFVGRAAYQAAGGKVDKNDPAISRANLEYVRKQLGPEIYSKFIDELVRLGIVRQGRLVDPNKISDINEMAVQFLKQAYSAYIVTTDRLYVLSKKIDSEFPHVSDPSKAPVPLESFLGKFLEINALYLDMLQDVESTTSASTAKILDQLVTGINNLPPELKLFIRRLLEDMSSKSLTRIQYPFSSDRGVQDIINLLKRRGTITGFDDPTVTLYDEALKAIISLKQQDKLTVDLAKEYARKII